MKRKPLFSARFDERFKNEWQMREYGSYEDAGEPESHIVAIIKRSPKGMIYAMSEDELVTISASANECSDRTEDEESRGYGTNNALKQLLNKII